MNKALKATVLWFDRINGAGLIRLGGRSEWIYACNIKGHKTWYPETACVYYLAGQVIECHVDTGFVIGDTEGTFDETKWENIKGQPHV